MPETEWSNGYELIANISMLFADVPVRERPAAARAAGFDRVESWWPFDDVEPEPDARGEFVNAFRDAAVGVVSLNTYAGDMRAGERGLAVVPGQGDRFDRNVRATASLAGELGCSFVHVLVGNGDPTDPDVRRLGIEQLSRAVELAADHGCRVLVEVLNPVDTPRYALTSLDTAIDWIGAVWDANGSDSIGLQFDAYHLAVIGHDLVAAVERCAHVLAHVQIADHPGRGAPGTGRIDFRRVTDALRSVGYDGVLSLEHHR